MRLDQRAIIAPTITYGKALLRQTAVPVAHIDPSDVFREGLRTVLAGTGFQIVWNGASALDAADLIPRLKPQMVIADVSGNTSLLDRLIEAAERIEPRPRIVILTSHLSAKFIAAVLGKGIDAYLHKDASSAVLRQTLELVRDGQKVLPRQLSELFAQCRMLADSAPFGLSAREIDVLASLLEGRSNKEIAERLHITEGTVKVHLKSLLKKMNVRNRTQAALWAMNAGIAPV